MVLGLWSNSIGFPGACGSSEAGGSDEKKGLAAWLIDRIRRRPSCQPRLAMIERISLAPRQTLSLVEAEGQKFLVATSPDGTPAFYPLSLPASCSGRNRSPKAISQEELA